MPKKIRTEITEIDPILAQEMLATQGKNRPVKTAHVQGLAKDMTEGRWKFDGAPIRFDRDGKLIDGQHRLLAVIASGTSQEFLVIDGITTEAQVVMDSGARRSAGDQLSMLGAPNSTIRAAAIRILVRIADGTLIGKPSPVTSSEVVEFSESNTRQLDWALDLALPTRRSIQSRLAVATSAAFLALKVSPEHATEFFGSVTSGANLGEDSPVLALIQGINGRKARSVKMDQAEELFYWVQAHNKWRARKPLTKLQIPANNTLSIEHLTMR